MSELISKLGIDWRLLIANTVTFFIVLWVLRRYAFRPIMGVLEKRQQMAQDTVTKSTQVEQDLVHLREKKEQTMQEAHQQSRAILQEAKKEALDVKANILIQAQAESDKIKDQTKTALTREKEEMLRAARGELADLVVAATTKVLQEKITVDVDKQLAKRSIEAAGGKRE